MFAAALFWGFAAAGLLYSVLRTSAAENKGFWNGKLV
jgi:hypothetical protein